MKNLLQTISAPFHKALTAVSRRSKYFILSIQENTLPPQGPANEINLLRYYWESHESQQQRALVEEIRRNKDIFDESFLKNMALKAQIYSSQIIKLFSISIAFSLFCYLIITGEGEKISILGVTFSAGANTKFSVVILTSLISVFMVVRIKELRHITSIIHAVAEIKTNKSLTRDIYIMQFDIFVPHMLPYISTVEEKALYRWHFKAWKITYFILLFSVYSIISIILLCSIVINLLLLASIYQDGAKYQFVFSVIIESIVFLYSISDAILSRFAFLVEDYRYLRIYNQLNELDPMNSKLNMEKVLRRMEVEK